MYYAQALLFSVTLTWLSSDDAFYILAERGAGHDTNHTRSIIVQRDTTVKGRGPSSFSCWIFKICFFFPVMSVHVKREQRGSKVDNIGVGVY